VVVVRAVRLMPMRVKVYAARTPDAARTTAGMRQLPFMVSSLRPWMLIASMMGGWNCAAAGGLPILVLFRLIPGQP
jgi:hypothetical protein